MFQNEVLVVGSSAIGATVQIHLQDSLERTLVHSYLDAFGPVFIDDFPSAVLWVERPVTQQMER